MTYSKHTTFSVNALAVLLLFWCINATFPAKAAINLPDLGSPDLKEYNSETEEALGRAFTTALHTQYSLIEDPEILSYIRRIGNKIVSQTGQDRAFSFYVINNPEINAFAGPNGVIGIHSGLIQAAQSEDELASVIAHEVAHVTQKHLSRSFEYQKETSLTTLATLIAAILIGSQDPGAGMAAYIGGAGFSMQQALNFSRIHEHEADYIGIQYLYKSQYNPHAMGKFFGRLNEASQYNEFKVPEILLTHPVTEKRLAQADDRAASFPPFLTAGHNHLDFPLIQVRLALLQNKENTLKVESLKAETLCYLNALKANLNQTALSQTDLACFETLNETDQSRLLKLIAIPSKASSIETEIKQYNALRAFYPEDFSILYRQAEMLQHHQATDKAIELLENKTPSYDSKFLLYQKLAELYATQNKDLEMNFYLAQANLAIGNLAKAKYLLKQTTFNQNNQNQKLYLQAERQLQALKKRDKPTDSDKKEQKQTP